MKSQKFIDLVDSELIFLIDQTPLSKSKIKTYWSNFINKNDEKNVELLWTIFMFLIWLKVFQKKIKF